MREVLSIVISSVLIVALPGCFHRQPGDLASAYEIPTIVQSSTTANAIISETTTPTDETTIASTTEETTVPVTEGAKSIQLTDLTSIADKPRNTDRLTDNYGNNYSYAIINNHGYSGSAGPIDYEYLLDGKYTAFKGTIYIPSDETSSGNSVLTVKGDDFILYTSPVMTKTSKPVDFEVSITGVNDLIVEWSNNSGYNNISSLKCCLTSAVLCSEASTGTTTLDVRSLPIAMTDLTSLYTVPKTTTQLTDMFGNTYGSAVYNYVDHLHGNSTPVYEYLLDKKYGEFKCVLYVPQGSTFKKDVTMTVSVDDKNIYQSPAMTTSSAPVNVELDISQCNNFKITFSDCSWYGAASDTTLCLGNAYFYLAK